MSPRASVVVFVVFLAVFVVLSGIAAVVLVERSHVARWKQWWVATAFAGSRLTVAAARATAEEAFPSHWPASAPGGQAGGYRIARRG